MGSQFGYDCLLALPRRLAYHGLYPTYLEGPRKQIYRHVPNAQRQERGMICIAEEWHLAHPGGCRHIQDRGHTMVGGVKRDDRHGISLQRGLFRRQALIVVTLRAYVIGADGDDPGNGRHPVRQLVST